VDHGKEIFIYGRIRIQRGREFTANMRHYQFAVKGNAVSVIRKGAFSKRQLSNIVDRIKYSRNNTGSL
jgi:hypothetical protein